MHFLLFSAETFCSCCEVADFRLGIQAPQDLMVGSVAGQPWSPTEPPQRHRVTKSLSRTVEHGSHGKESYEHVQKTLNRTIRIIMNH